MCVLYGAHLSMQLPDIAVHEGAVLYAFPDSKIHRANMGPTWVLSSPDGHHIGPMNLAIRVGSQAIIRADFKHMCIEK